MAIPVLEACAQGLDVASADGLDFVATRWLEWGTCGAGAGKGIGLQTLNVFAMVLNAQDAQEPGKAPQPLGITMAKMAAEAHAASGRSAGNGCLMRVGPLALGYLHPGDAPRLADAAMKQASLTHHEPDGGDAAALWALAIRHAILTGQADLRAQLAHLPEERRALWSDRIDAAEQGTAHDFAHKNNWVVAALQCAWIAVRAGSDVRTTLEAAVKGLGDTDTIAAIAGALAGALYGADSVPREWRQKLHGWPGYTARDMERLVDETLARYPSLPDVQP
jgi:ADP-ribosylglycohydrolase